MTDRVRRKAKHQARRDLQAVKRLNELGGYDFKRLPEVVEEIESLSGSVRALSRDAFVAKNEALDEVKCQT